MHCGKVKGKRVEAEDLDLGAGGIALGSLFFPL
jgi:hypothetical protein